MSNSPIPKPPASPPLSSPAPAAVASEPNHLSTTEPSLEPTSEPTTTQPLQNNTTTTTNNLSRLVSRTPTINLHVTPLWRKSLIVFVTSWLTLAACFSSTSLFTAATEIGQELGISVEAVNVSSAGVLLAMGFSSFIWGPVEMMFGRRVSYNGCIFFLLAFTIGTAVARTKEAFIVLRVLAGLQGTYFHVAGQTILADYFPPTQRGTATGFFLSGTVLGPPLGPLMGGIIVTFKSWRVVLWLQAAMILFGWILAILFISHNPPNKDEKRSIGKLLGYINPMNVFGLMRYPNVFLADLACGLLSWSQYSLLSAPRHIISTRFGLTSPLLSGLFYISPAGGFLLGTIVGGRYSDLTVRKWIAKRGMRLPQDRLHSGMIAFFVVIPVASLIYGWGMECGPDGDGKCPIGRLAVPVIFAFFTAAGLLAAFASLNTYCAEMVPGRRRDAIAGKYCIQYTFSAASSAASVPFIDAAGSGATSTFSSVLVMIAGVVTLITAIYGSRMQNWVDGVKESERDPHMPRWPKALFGSKEEV